MSNITITIDEDKLSGYSDEYLATCWHVAQANPAPMDDLAAGEIAERVGREIIRRWLRCVSPELWRHQGRHHYWSELTKHASGSKGEAMATTSDRVPQEQEDEKTSAL